MVSGFIGNEVPRKGLRVRFPCPPLKENAESNQRARHFFLNEVAKLLAYPDVTFWSGNLTTNLLPWLRALVTSIVPP